MPLTNAQKQARQRERVKAKLERLAVLEEALGEIANDGARGAQDIRDFARKALGVVSSNDTRQPTPGVYGDGQGEEA